MESYSATSQGPIACLQTVPAGAGASGGHVGEFPVQYLKDKNFTSKYRTLPYHRHPLQVGKSLSSIL